MAILDFGLMTEISDDIKFGMIEAIAHLIHRDYEAIVEDFVTLDFIPPGVDLQPILPVLAKVFDQALEGGGAKSINFQVSLQRLMGNPVQISRIWLCHGVMWADRLAGEAAGGVRHCRRTRRHEGWPIRRAGREEIEGKRGGM